MAFDFRQGLHEEWEETDGFGSTASGTHSGPNTKRHHALLAFTDSSNVPWILVNHLEEWFEFRGKRIPLTSTVYFDFASAGRMAIHPQGYVHLAEFTPHPYPRWIYAFEGVRFVKTIRPVKASPGFLVEYALISDCEAEGRIFVRPMISGRRATELHIENRAIRTDVTTTETSLLIEPYPGVPSIVVGFPVGVGITHEPQWYRRIRLTSSPRDEEALISPISLALPLTSETPAWLRFSAGSLQATSALEASVVLVSEALAPPPLAAALRRSIAFHTLEADAPLAARFVHPAGGAASLSDGVWALGTLVDLLEPDMLRKLFAGYAHGIPEAPLDVRLRWVSCLGEAARRGVTDREITAAGLDLVGAILDGRAMDAAPTSNMLLLVRAEGSSWWERVEKDGPPRFGFPIEIQALWANALAGAEILSRTLAGSISDGYGRPFLRALESIRNLYWNPDTHFLYDNIVTDVTDPAEVDLAALRKDPRISSAALLAQSLRFDILPPSRARALLATAKSRLASPPPDTTPGLRAFEGAAKIHPWLCEVWLRAWQKASADADPRFAPPSVREKLSPPSDILALAGLVAASILEETHSGATSPPASA